MDKDIKITAKCDICEMTLDGVPRVGLEIVCEHQPRNVELCWECGKSIANRLGVSERGLRQALMPGSPMPAC